MSLQAWRDLLMPKEVRYEDVIFLAADPCVFHKKKLRAASSPEPRLRSHSTSPTKGRLIGMWDDRIGKERTTVHHFCTMTSEVQLPEPYRGLWREHLTLGKRGYGRNSPIEVRFSFWPRRFPFYSMNSTELM